MNENTINNRAKKLNLKVQNYCDKEYYLTDLSNHAVAPGPMTLEQLDSWIGYLEGTPTPSFSNNFKFAQKDRLRAAHAICESLKDYARKYVVCSDNEREKSSSTKSTVSAILSFLVWTTILLVSRLTVFPI